MHASKTIRVRNFPISGEMKHLYITIVYNDMKIHKVFLHIGKGSTQDIADFESITRLINLHLSAGSKVEDIIRALQNIDSGIRFHYEDRTVKSLSDLLAVILRREINELKEEFYDAT
jgi:hypothetical protein